MVSSSQFTAPIVPSFMELLPSASTDPPPPRNSRASLMKEIKPLVWEANPLKDIRASPANRMTRAVLSIVVMFVCLAHTMEASQLGDLKKKNEAMELRFNSFKEDYNAEKDALAEGIREQNRLHATLPMLEQYSGPEFASIKKKLETLKESNSKLNAEFLLMTEVSDHKFQILQKKIEGIKDLVHEIEDDGGWNLLARVRKCQSGSIEEKPLFIWQQTLPNRMQDIRASPANRMTRAVLSILVMFVCLAPMLEVNSTMDDFKMVIEDVELYINSLKEEDLEMVANSLIDEQIRITNNILNVIQLIGPEYVVVKKLFESVMEFIPELKAKWLKSPEDYKLFWEYIQKAIEGLKVLHETMVIKDEL
ncbi:unnamed protein product [Arctogadus glacialis]